ncbi:MAG: transcription antitermination factor NusB [Myxococcota bacterium]|nr:transcription antitermination factor NusB [Myxococcota bacterium]
MSAGGSRHRGRELALQALYAVDVELRRPAREAEPLHSVDLEAPVVEVERALEAAGVVSPDSPRTTVDVSEVEARRVFDGIAANFEAPPTVRDFAWRLVSEVCARTDCLDGQIAARARNWRITRMAAVDRNILRLGTYELAHTSTPAPVVMDEAVELARRYGSDASPAFVNGILDALATDLRSGAS